MVALKSRTDEIKFLTLKAYFLSGQPVPVTMIGEPVSTINHVDAGSYELIWWNSDMPLEHALDTFLSQFYITQGSFIGHLPPYYAQRGRAILRVNDVQRCVHDLQAYIMRYAPATELFYFANALPGLAVPVSSRCYFTTAIPDRVSYIKLKDNSRYVTYETAISSALPLVISNCRDCYTIGKYFGFTEYYLLNADPNGLQNELLATRNGIYHLSIPTTSKLAVFDEIRTLRVSRSTAAFIATDVEAMDYYAIMTRADRDALIACTVGDRLYQWNGVPLIKPTTITMFWSSRVVPEDYLDDVYPQLAQKQKEAQQILQGDLDRHFYEYGLVVFIQSVASAKDQDINTDIFTPSTCAPELKHLSDCAADIIDCDINNHNSCRPWQRLLWQRYTVHYRAALATVRSFSSYDPKDASQTINAIESLLPTFIPQFTKIYWETDGVAYAFWPFRSSSFITNRKLKSAKTYGLRLIGCILDLFESLPELTHTPADDLELTLESVWDIVASILMQSGVRRAILTVQPRHTSTPTEMEKICALNDLYDLLNTYKRSR